jgi:hypothetical protein
MPFGDDELFTTVDGSVSCRALLTAAGRVNQVKCVEGRLVKYHTTWSHICVDIYRWTACLKCLCDYSCIVDFDIHYFRRKCNVASRTLHYVNPENILSSFRFIEKRARWGVTAFRERTV